MQNNDNIYWDCVNGDRCTLYDLKNMNKSLILELMSDDSVF